MALKLPFMMIFFILSRPLAVPFPGAMALKQSRMAFMESGI